MNVNNLTNVYNQNPTLQGQYTLQQYLDLYGQGSTTSTSTTPTTTTTPTTNTSQGIINANINQFQNQGGNQDNRGVKSYTSLQSRTPDNRELTQQGDYYTDGTKAPEKGNLNFLGRTVQGAKNIGSSIMDSKLAKGIGFGVNALTGNIPGMVMSGLTSLAGNFENRELSGKGTTIDEFGNIYDGEDLNSQNALGGYYTDAARSSRRRRSRIANMLDRIAKGKKISAANLAKLQAQEKAQEKAREAATQSMAAKNAADHAAGRGSRGGYQAGYGGDFMGGRQGGIGGQSGGLGGNQGGPGGTASMGSSKDGGLMGYGGKSGTPKYKQKSYFKGGLVSLRGK